MWGGSVTEKLFAAGLCLPARQQSGWPSGSGMSDEDVRRMVEVMRKTGNSEEWKMSNEERRKQLDMEKPSPRGSFCSWLLKS
jgi:hypothetical protein